MTSGNCCNHQRDGQGYHGSRQGCPVCPPSSAVDCAPLRALLTRYRTVFVSAMNPEYLSFREDLLTLWHRQHDCACGR